MYGLGYGDKPLTRPDHWEKQVCVRLDPSCLLFGALEGVGSSVADREKFGI